MAEAEKPTNSETEAGGQLIEAGKVSQWLTENDFTHNILESDHLGVEIIKVERDFLIPIATALMLTASITSNVKGVMMSVLERDLVSFYHLIKVSDNADRPEEVRLKVFLPRNDPRVPSVYWIWKTADWQEREAYDMYGIVYEGHPNLKRILMPEDWVGYPLRKDYVSPDFYELQEAY